MHTINVTITSTQTVSQMFTMNGDQVLYLHTAASNHT